MVERKLGAQPILIRRGSSSGQTCVNYSTAKPPEFSFNGSKR